MNSHVITPGPYRATKLWNEVTRLFRSGMPLKKHRQNFRHHASCFTASAAVDWLHQLLRSNSNFGPDVTRQQTVQLLKKFLKNHVIEDVKGRWGTEDLEDSNSLYRFPSTSPQKPIPRLAPASSSIRKRPSLRDKDGFFRFRSLKKLEKETQENVDPALQTGEENHPAGEQQMQRRELTVEDEQDIWRDITLTHLQRILGLASLEEVLNQRSVNPHNIIHNMTKVNKHGVVTLDDKTNDLPHWVLSAMKSLANWPKYDSAQPSYPGFERDVFKTVSDYFYSLPQPLLTYELYELFINVLGLLQSHCERVAIEALQLCTLLLPPTSRRKLQLLMRMMSRISQNVDMPQLHPAIGTRTLMVHTFSGCVLGSAEECDLDELLATRLVSFLLDHQQSILSVPDYLLSAISDHVQYLRTAQVPIDTGFNVDSSDVVSIAVPVFAFCRQISGAEFEQQKQASSRKAMEDLLEILLTDQNISEKDRRKKLKQFQKQYPDIYSHRCSTSDHENKTDNKPKIKPALLNIKKTKAFSIRN
ncbi:DEP domain-containing protein 1A isoform X2 [Hippoglossus hippoglossus]|uniref:DEP domain-containing protein 1A isoform X2 n=1 Tax=Hippoglossus hippoglossus TaxID=8267 RepID=UPI00148C89EB|nr:DEP domain-containing protein 1A isoform X2 [Hippoglossus hippoglossus]